MSRGRGGAEDGEAEMTVSGERDESPRWKEPHVPGAGSGKQYSAKHVSERACKPQGLSVFPK